MSPDDLPDDFAPSPTAAVALTAVNLRLRVERARALVQGLRRDPPTTRRELVRALGLIDHELTEPPTSTHLTDRRGPLSAARDLPPLVGVVDTPDRPWRVLPVIHEVTDDDPMRECPPSPFPTVPDQCPLTATELDVVQRIADGLSLDEIAKTTHRSRNTIKTHVARISHTLKVRGQVQIVALCFRHLWIT